MILERIMDFVQVIAKIIFDGIIMIGTMSAIMGIILQILRVIF